MRQTLVFMSNSAIGENFNFTFQQFSAGIKDVLSLEGRLDTRL